MAHESFEDPGTADLMNELFVNVKVDREERPDVDAVYMQAVQALTGRGGWPMSVWCTPDGQPFYGGTYYPNEERHGMPSFARVCAAVSEAWRERRDEVLDHAGKLTEAIDEQVLRPDARVELSRQTLRDAYDNVARQFEPNYGGFGTAPKFPPAMTLEFLCRAFQRNGSDQTYTMITTTLDAMAAGGMYDQIGGGFARYSTDNEWLVPHFEKMLYDNALADARRTCTRICSPANRGTSGSSKRRSNTCCGISPIGRAASMPPRTQIPRASKASSTSGLRTRSERCAATTPTR